MPVRSLTSSVLRWPDHNQVITALNTWVQTITHPPTPIQAIGYFGSYARGDYGVGSDLDLLIILHPTDLSPDDVRCTLTPDLSTLPVPAESLIYTQTAWQQLQASQSRFAQTLAAEAQWVWGQPDETGMQSKLSS